MKSGSTLSQPFPDFVFDFISFQDQFFWASQVRKVGAGTRVASLDVSDLKSALEKAAQDRIMAEKAADIGEKIRKENGVENAIRFVYNNLLSAQRTPHPLPPKAPSRSSTAQGARRASSLSKTFSFSEDEEEEGQEDGDRTTLTSRSLRLVSSPLSLARGSTASSSTKEKEKDGSSTPKRSGSFCRRDTSSSTTSSKETPTSSTASTPAAVNRRDPSSTTIVEEGEEQDQDETSKEEVGKPPEKKASFFGFSHSRVPSLTGAHSRVSSLTGALGSLLPSTSSEDEDGADSDRPGTPKAEKDGEKDGEKEEKKEAYSRKRAKAEDIRRRELLKERLRKEREEKEGIVSEGESGNNSKEDLKLK